jgi:hypothetical protein
MSKIIEINNFLDNLLIPRLLSSKDFLIILRGDQEGLFKLVTLNGILKRITGVTLGC